MCGAFDRSALQCEPDHPGDRGFGFHTCPRSVAVDPGIGAHTRLVRIQRVTLANGKTIALMLNHLLPELAPGIVPVGRVNGAAGPKERRE